MFVIVLGLIAIVATALAVPEIQFSADVEVQQSKWTAFKIEFDKEYATADEEALRFGRFVDSLQLIDQRNAHAAATGQHTEHGLTKFSDLSQDEFEKQVLTYRPEPCAIDGTCAAPSEDVIVVTEIPEMTAGVTYSDWSAPPKIYTTPIKDQGECNSCWAFTAVEQIESDYLRVKSASAPTRILSVGQVTSCAMPYNPGCSYGSPYAAYDYIKNMNGLLLNSTFPYTIPPKACNIPVDTDKWYVRIRKTIYRYPDELLMGGRVLNIGPISVCFDGTNMNTYKKGYLSCFGNKPNHCAQAVGLTVDPARPFIPFPGLQWKIRNQLGVKFGDYGGYLYIPYGSNACTINADSTSVDIAEYKM